MSRKWFWTALVLALMLLPCSAFAADSMKMVVSVVDSTGEQLTDPEVALTANGSTFSYKSGDSFDITIGTDTEYTVAVSKLPAYMHWYGDSIEGPTTLSIHWEGDSETELTYDSNVSFIEVCYVNEEQQTLQITLQNEYHYYIPLRPASVLQGQIRPIDLIDTANITCNDKPFSAPGMFFQAFHLVATDEQGEEYALNNPATLTSLLPGTYTVHAVANTLNTDPTADSFASYSFGNPVTMTVVPAAENPQEPDENVTITPTTSSGHSVPKTGDSSQLWLWLALLLTSGCILLTSTARKAARNR